MWHNLPFRRVTPGFRYGVPRPSACPRVCVRQQFPDPATEYEPGGGTGAEGRREEGRARRLGGEGAEARPWERPGAGGGCVGTWSVERGVRRDLLRSHDKALQALNCGEPHGHGEAAGSDGSELPCPEVLFPRSRRLSGVVPPCLRGLRPPGARRRQSHGTARGEPREAGAHRPLGDGAHAHGVGAPPAPHRPRADGAPRPIADRSSTDRNLVLSPGHPG